MANKMSEKAQRQSLNALGDLTSALSGMKDYSSQNKQEKSAFQPPDVNVQPMLKSPLATTQKTEETNQKNQKVNKQKQQTKRKEAQNQSKKSSEFKIEKKPPTTLMQDEAEDGYSVGAFAQFAINIEKEMNKKNSFIKRTIKQAVLSYEIKLKQNYQHIESLLGLSTLNQSAPFKTQEEVKQYLKSQSQYTLRRMKQAVDVKKLVYQQAVRKKYLFKTAVIDGKVVQVAKLKFSDRFYHNGNLFLSTDVKDLYVKLSSLQKPVKVIFREGKFLQQKDFIIDSERVKEQIIGMVLLYLKSKDIILEADEIEKTKILIGQQMKTVKN